MGESKIALRTVASSRRSALSQKDVLSRSLLIQARVCQFSEFLSSQSIALYASIQNEVRTDKIRDHALRQGKRVFYPVLRTGGTTQLIRLESAGKLSLGRFGVLEPSGEEQLPDVWQEALFIVVPGLAFDLSGNRLGRGKGWYDRLLKRLGKNAVAAALAYDCQIVDQVPVEPWDERVAYIFTETKRIDCRESGRKTLSAP
jgi:5-formyltetrahydrofolate cyclo-ligase